ncbi:single-stranded DNA-binding protein [Striga asiatica]|uniref:Single-stranded DNA-binding protein n=1 Tax=Striga asiatica TaxID=4170 RepID=A0A5A7RDL8_STRAF|nr:single-stranded DNA-binding protein [Striga asiatica]
MALEQTLAVKSHILIYHLPRPTASSLIFTLNPKNRRSSSRIKCSFDYNGSGTAANNGSGFYEYERGAETSAVAESMQHPKPAEIQWNKELCNTVQFIGVIAAPVQIKHFPSGKVVANSRLTVKTNKTDTVRINLNFWNELAQVAFQHVEIGHQVYVAGRLVADTVQDDNGMSQTYYKVIVKELNFIERSQIKSSTPLYYGDSNSARQGKKQYPTNSTGSLEELWQAFFANPTEWWDNRKNKKNPNYPDFKHKDTGESLWVDGRYNPSWVKSQLDVLDSKMESFREQNLSAYQNFMSVDNLGPF